jgi:hypothetical protein
MAATKLTGPVMLSAVGDSATRHSSAQATPGARAYSEDGEFVYVTAGGAITTSGDPVTLAGVISAVVRGDLDTGAFLGCAEAPFASGESGYVRTKGPTLMVVESGAVAGDELELSGTVGKLKKYAGTTRRAVAIATVASDNASTARILVHLCGGA